MENFIKCLPLAFTLFSAAPKQYNLSTDILQREGLDLSIVRYLGDEITQLLSSNHLMSKRAKVLKRIVFEEYVQSNIASWSGESSKTALEGHEEGIHFKISFGNYYLYTRLGPEFTADLEIFSSSKGLNWSDEIELNWSDVAEGPVEGRHWSRIEGLDSKQIFGLLSLVSKHDFGDRVSFTIYFDDLGYPYHVDSVHIGNFRWDCDLMQLFYGLHKVREKYIRVVRRAYERHLWENEPYGKYKPIMVKYIKQHIPTAEFDYVSADPTMPTPILHEIINYGIPIAFFSFVAYLWMYS